MNDPLSLVSALNTEIIPATSQPRLVYGLLTVQVDAPSTAPAAVTMDLVVDASNSMKIPLITDEQFQELASLGAVREVVQDGIPVWHFDFVPPGFADQCPKPIDIVKIALVAGIQALRTDDRCGLVAFASNARRLSSIVSASRSKDLLKSVGNLETIDLGDDTRLASGLALSVRELMHQDRFPSPSVRRVVVLTDGFARDEQEALRWGQQAAEAGISISTMGLGAEFNEQLLLTLADASGGNAYFFEDLSEILDAFEKELSAAQSVILRDLELKLKLYGGVELRRAYRVKPTIRDLGVPDAADGSVNIPLGDLDTQAPPAVLLELIVPPRPAGRYRLAQAALAHTDPTGMPGPKAIADLLVEARPEPVPAGQMNAQIMNIVETVSAYRLQTRALADAEAGDFTGATTKLRAAATRLLGLGEDELAQAAMQEADNLDQQGALSSAGTKKLRYETRKLTQKLG